MAIEIRPYTGEWAGQVRAFNARLSAAGIQDFHLDDETGSPAAPEAAGRRLFEKSFLAVEQDAVRGGYILNHQRLSIAGVIHAAAHYRLPLSEGLIDRRYAGVALQMLRAALQCQPLLFCLGMGGEDRPLPQMLKAMKWALWPVPFHFKVLSPSRFLRQMPVLRTGAFRKLVLDLAAWSGAGAIAVNLVQRRNAAMTDSDTGTRAEPVECFGSWADQLWNQCHEEYALLALRDAATLNVCYPRSDARFLRLRIRRGGDTIGWVVMLDTPMRDDKHFGNLRVGTIADCLARSADAAAVVAAAARALAERKVDLIVSNQAHETWSAACTATGFLTARSNYIFAASPTLTKLLAPLEQHRGRVHITRGDGDGPIHL